MEIEFTRTIPIFRIFSVEKAKEFYIGYLGFTVDWEHRFEESSPVYMQISRGNLVIHLSEHHGDCCPGSTALVYMKGVEELHREISAKNYKYLRPGVEKMPWNALSVKVIDPFGNRIDFQEPLELQ
jgi:hypothetical protein